jgi:PAS domain S-box-containing protein
VEHPPASEQPTILVVEDDPPTAQVICDLLVGEGYRVSAAADGATARALLAADSVDLVLLDLMLPDVSGLDICYQVRSQDRGVYLPIIMLTALAAERDRHAGFAAGADDYVAKPFELDDLLDRVRVWTRTRERLKRQHEALVRQASLLDLASDAIYVRDLAHRVTYWSAGAETLYGWSRDEAQGQVAHALLRTTFPQPLADLDAAVVRDGSWAGELVHTRRDGSPVRVTSRWALQRDAADRPRAILVLDTDVTVWEALRDAERARLANRLESLTRAARELAHLLNNDLALAVGTTQLLQLEPEPALPDQLRALVDEAALGLAAATEHIDQLHRLARGTPPTPPP